MVRQGTVRKSALPLSCKKDLLLPLPKSKRTPRMDLEGTRFQNIFRRLSCMIKGKYFPLILIERRRMFPISRLNKALIPSIQFNTILSNFIRLFYR